MDLESQLMRLEAAQLVRRSLEPDLAYLFKHTLTQETIYHSLLKKTRGEIHRLVAESYESVFAGRLDDQAAILARHYAEAGEDSKALAYARQAGDAAAAVYANQEALMHYALALEVAERSAAPAAALRRARGRIFEILGHFDQARTDYEGALAESRARADRPGEWQALLDLGLLWAERDYERTGVYYRQAFELAASFDDPSFRAHSLNRVGNWYLNIDQPATGRPYHEQALAIFRSLGDRRGTGETLDLLGMTTALGGDMGEAAIRYREAIPLFAELDERRWLSSSLATLALRGATFQTDCMAAIDSLAEATRDAQESVRVAREIGWRSGEAFGLFVSTICFGSQGQYGAAFQAVRSSLAIGEEIGHQQWLTAAQAALGCLYRDLLVPELGRGPLLLAVQMAHRIGSWHWIRTAAGLAAMNYLQMGEGDQAEVVLREAGAPGVPGESLGQRLALCGYAELLLSRGQAEQALEVTRALDAASVPLAKDRPSLRVCYLAGRALGSLGRYGESEEKLRIAETIARQQGALPMLWRIGVELARSLEDQGRQTAAARELSGAREIVARIAAEVPDETLRRSYEERAAALVGAAHTGVAHET